jgi:hypothetical protein
MAIETEQTKKLKAGCRIKSQHTTEKVVESKNVRFDPKSEVFVIRLNKITGEFMGKYVCCALASV